MKKLLLILLIPIIGFGQGWETTFGGTGIDKGQSVQQTTDGGYVIVGQTGATGQPGSVYLLKTDGNGVEQWSQTFFGISGASGNSVQQTTDGGYVIVGQTAILGTSFESDVYLIKTDGSGIEQWGQTFGGAYPFLDNGFSIQQTTDGGYVIVGSSYSSQAGALANILLIKTDGNGVEQWSQSFGGALDDEGYSVQQTTDGGYIITGKVDGSFDGSQDSDICLKKTNGNGVVQWSQTFGGTENDFGKSVQQTNDGGYIITGMFDASDICLIKTDGNGVEQWSQIFGGNGENSQGYSVQQTTDGGYIITGQIRVTSPVSDWDVYLIKTDGSGIEQWSQTFGGTSDDFGYSVQQTTDDGYIITGCTGDYPSDIYLIKTDGSGNATSTFNIPINPNRKLEKTVDLLGRETKPQTNTPLIKIYDDGTVEKRIVIE